MHYIKQQLSWKKPTLACNPTETRPGNSVTKHPQQFSLLKTHFFKSSPDLQPEYSRNEAGTFVSPTTVIILFRTGCAIFAQVCIWKKENCLSHRVLYTFPLPVPMLSCLYSAVCWIAPMLCSMNHDKVMTVMLPSLLALEQRTVHWKPSTRIM